MLVCSTQRDLKIKEQNLQRMESVRAANPDTDAVILDVDSEYKMGDELTKELIRKHRINAFSK